MVNKDQIIEELLALKKEELEKSPQQQQTSYTTPIKFDGSHQKLAPNEEYNLNNCFVPENMNYNMYSRNVPKLQAMHSQPHYLSYNLECAPLEMKNLNAESINLNHSMSSVNSYNSNYEKPMNTLGKVKLKIRKFTNSIQIFLWFFTVYP